MAAPTRITGVATALNTTTSPKTTSSLTLSVNDILVCIAGAGGPSSGMAASPSVSAGAVTWTLQQSVAATGFGDIKLWTGVVTSAGTATVSVTCTGGLSWGFIVEQYAAGAVVGTSVVNHSASGNATISISPTVASAALVSGSTDFNGTTGTITWSTINGSAETAQATVQTASDYGAYYGYAPDSGPTGAETVGVTAPTGQAWAIVAVEIQGASAAVDNVGSKSTNVHPGKGPGNAKFRIHATTGTTPTNNYIDNEADTGSGTDSATFVQNQNLTPADTGAGTDSATFVQDNVRAAADTGSGTDSATFVQNQNLTLADTGSGSDSAAAVQAMARTAADTGAGSDSASQVQSQFQTLPDTGSGADSLTPVQAMARTAADTGSGTDTAVASFLLIQNVADTGAGADSITVLQNMAPTLADSGSGSDTASFIAALARTAADTGSGTDSLASQADNVRTTADTGSGTDAIAAAAAINRAVADSGAGSDTFIQLMAYSRTAADTGAGSDAIGIEVTSILRDLALTSVPLGTRWAVAATMARWAAVQNSRWMTIAWDTRWAVQANINRFTTTPEAPMGTDIIISAGAAVYVGGTITEITGKDISGGTFQISLGSDLQPGPWLTPDVLQQGATTASKVVKLLVSSTLPSGIVKGTYWAWVRVTDSPEIQPLRVQGPINVR